MLVLGTSILLIIILFGFCIILFLPSIVKRTKESRNNCTTVKLGEKIFTLDEKKIQIYGDAEISQGSRISEDIEATDSLTIGNNTHIFGSLLVHGDLIIGNDVVVEGKVKAGKNALIGENSLVKGKLEAGGAITLRENSLVYGDVKAHKSITLGRGAQVHSTLTTNMGLRLVEGAAIGGPTIQKDITYIPKIEELS